MPFPPTILGPPLILASPCLSAAPPFNPSRLPTQRVTFGVIISERAGGIFLRREGWLPPTFKNCWCWGLKKTCYWIASPWLTQNENSSTADWRGFPHPHNQSRIVILLKLDVYFSSIFQKLKNWLPSIEARGDCFLEQLALALFENADTVSRGSELNAEWSESLEMTLTFNLSEGDMEELRRHLENLK